VSGVDSGLRDYRFAPQPATKFLGRTGLEVSEIAFGGIPVMRLSKQEGARLVREVLERGVNFIDTAYVYGDSEEKIGAALREVDRKTLVISSKSPARDGETLREHLETSLRRLGTDYFDIYHLHNISKPEEIDAVLEKGGAVEELHRAVDEGLVRYPAVSSHNAAICLDLIDLDTFDVVQFPLNFVDNEAEKEILPRAKERNLGFIAMKPLGGGMLDRADLCFRYLMQFPEVFPDPGIERIEELEEILTIIADKRPVSEEEKAAIEEIRRTTGDAWCHRCDYCRPCVREIPISTILLAESVTKRMPRKDAEQFLTRGMEKAESCIECRECVERCPYDLDIPRLIAERVRGWKEFRRTGAWPGGTATG
jgi:hypothetical protein